MPIPKDYKDARPKAGEPLKKLLVGKIYERFGRRFECSCLAPGGECMQKVIKAHSIQNHGALGAIAEHGHVIMPKARLSLEPPRAPITEFHRVGRREASTFTGLCAVHDNRIFAPVDDNALDPEDSEQMLLLAYRAIMRETHACMQAAERNHSSYQASVELGYSSPGQPNMLLAGAAHHSLAAREAFGLKRLYDEAYLRGDHAAVEHVIVRLPAERPSLAVNAMFSEGERRGALMGVTINVFPHGGRHVLVVSFLRRHRPFAEPIAHAVMGTFGPRRLEAASRLVLRKCENMVLRPSLWDSFTDEQREAIRIYLVRTIFDPELDPDDPRLNLFEAVA